MYNDTLKLVSSLDRRKPSTALPSRLEQLFRHLHSPDCAAEDVEEQIWLLWMHYPHARAAEVLDKAASDIAAQRYDIAETRLDRLLRACPDYAEAWNKRATLYYLQQRDHESVLDIHRTLELEPRHFGALSGLGEIYLSSGDFESALFVFQTALRVNPHMASVRAEVGRLAAASSN